MSLRRVMLWLLLLVCGVPVGAYAQASAYRISFPDLSLRSMQVELQLTDLPAGPLELHFSRSSPGRYAAHDFVSTVTDVEITNASGAMLQASHPTPWQWQVQEPDSEVRVRYRISGDRTDGTYLSINSTHAHLNMPATLMWARGFEDGAMTVRFEPPPDSGWKVATQLFPGPDESTFTAPNLQYLMDSPTELSAFTLRAFTATASGRAAEIRLAVHHEGRESDADALLADVQRIVREGQGIFGELPAFDGGTYTFIADYRPSVVADGMEHRNSTVVTWPGSIASDRAEVLAGLSHEFFHAWNVERIRPQSLEPFDFDAVNRSGELWLAEGFTQYYGPLMLVRAGLMTQDAFAAEIGSMVREVLASPARQARTLEEMSRLATIVDGGPAADIAGVRGTYLSYYTWGGAVALGLDLTLRERSNGRITLDTFMRTLWERHGRPGGRAPGYVDRPYTVDDLEDALATVSGDMNFARDFFARFIQGRGVVEYERLFARAGLVWQASARGGQTLVLSEQSGRAPAAAQRDFRAKWLASAAVPPNSLAPN